MFQLINQSRIPESRGLLSGRGRESRRRQSRQKTVSASTCLRRGVHKCKLAFSVVLLLKVRETQRFRIGDEEGILEDAVDDGGLFRGDVSSVTPGWGVGIIHNFRKTFAFAT